MNLNNSRVMVLGGWGLVGMAVCRKILARAPKTLYLLSLREHEAKEACAVLEKEFPQVEYVPLWGDIFVTEDLKDRSRAEVMENSELRCQFISDIYERPTEERLSRFFLNRIITKHQPDVIVDCVNSATGLAYQDIYTAYFRTKTNIDIARETGTPGESCFEETEKFLGTVSLPQLIRHVQVLLDGTRRASTHTYIKVGTTGTGGMGLNIPYTHSEERPSGQLLSKSSLAGAHSMLLFLMGRTPGCPYIKEVKPAATIAWKAIAFGEVKRGGQPIRMYDCPPENAEKLEARFSRKKGDAGVALNRNLESVYIDTGENGIFSAGEFFAITASEQMEFVTPEEIAQAVLWEIEGGNSGLDVVAALDSVSMGPTYRAGILRESALKHMAKLEAEHDIESVAFEILGPPRLSKLLYEAHLLRKTARTFQTVLSQSASELSQITEALIRSDANLRASVLS
ncbi:short-chain dehydrogenase, partial [bacterium]|nr:short-chain dehydrogenase [bacterium]